tara:strand:- start:422 stop:1366 length:945 start_codon:yes stop_codon:yes gene_type:complete
MAVRSPLKNDSGNVKEMTSAEVNQIVDQIVYQYSLNPSVSLSVVSSGGSLGTITDTRLQAGAMSQTNSSFPNEATTAEPSVVTVSYDKISQSIASVSPTADSGKTWPAFYNASGHIQAMDLDDVKDTFLHPAINLLTSASIGTQQAGTYHISTTSSVSGSTLVSATPVFLDTRADTSAYSNAGLENASGEALDQPTTITSYYLQRIDGSNTSYLKPFYINAGNNLQEFATGTFESLVQGWIRRTAADSSDGFKLDYNLGVSGTGEIRGSGMGDTRLNGTGNYQTRQVSDDYRAQEFPDGTPTNINTYYLRIRKS